MLDTMIGVPTGVVALLILQPVILREEPLVAVGGPVDGMQVLTRFAVPCLAEMGTAEVAVGAGTWEEHTVAVGITTEVQVFIAMGVTEVLTGKTVTVPEFNAKAEVPVMPTVDGVVVVAEGEVHEAVTAAVEALIITVGAP